MTQSPLPNAPNPWITRPARIVDVDTEYHGVKTYRLQATQNDSSDLYSFVPGQFNMLYLPGVGESAISMSGRPDRPTDWTHTIRIAGNVTRSLAALQSGDTLGVRGPFGAGWPIPELRGRDVVLVAGGLGLAPLRPLIYHVIRQRDQFGSISLIIGARSPASLLYRTEFDLWRQAGLEVQPTVDQPESSWSGPIGVVTLPLERVELARPDQTSLLTCGPEVMMKYVALTAIRRGIAADQVWVSMERNMQCAVGLCGHCQWGAAFICKDGPVLRYDRIQATFSVESL